ncbi:MAG: phosphoheptose isomerase [Gammaproteobacteria bacterium]|nr:MAG: phosphoheptose isomerase [Gammaproteobacteria bacterium]RLA56745.1 MAG: phosphoheptose isomerase [Gammaproteobacteria bacterium]HDY83191.1 SIS domain-containing protein [Halieaceae bacterium]
MDHYPIIAENFQSTIETIALSVDNLAEPIERGSQLMTRALLEDRKIIACGNGVDAALAQLFTCNLLSRFEHERPALPALTLGGDGASITAITHSSGVVNIFSRQLRALGQAGDVLLCINSSGGANNLLRAVQAAHERNMTVVALSNTGDSEFSTLIRAQDVELRVDTRRQPRIVELHTMAIHCLCELIDHGLFGTYQE